MISQSFRTRYLCLPLQELARQDSTTDTKFSLCHLDLYLIQLCDKPNDNKIITYSENDQEMTKKRRSFCVRVSSNVLSDLFDA